MKNNEIEAIIKLLETTHDDHTRRIAAETLGKIGTGNPNAIEALIKVLETNQNEALLD
jgi:HEAT repeat protein